MKETKILKTWHIEVGIQYTWQNIIILHSDYWDYSIIVCQTTT